MTADSHLAVLRALSEPHVLVTPAGLLAAVNPAARRMLGADADIESGRPFTDLVQDTPTETNRLLAAFARSSSTVPGAVTLRTGERIRVDGCVLSSAPGEAAGLILLKLQHHKSAASRFLALNHTIEELTREARVRRQAEETVRASERRARFLAESTRVLLSSLDQQTTLRNIARLAVPEFADWCAVDVLESDGSLRRVAVQHSDPDKVRLAYELAERYPADTASLDKAHAVIRTGRVESAPVIPAEVITAAAQDDEHLRILRGLALHSYVVAPLVGRDTTLGAITLVYAESRRSYGEEDVVMAEDLARRAAMAIENARLVAAVEEARDRIAEQATELEAQTEELQGQSTMLEEQAAEMEEQAAELEQQLENVQALNEELGQSNQAMATARAEAESAREQAETARAEAERASQAKSTFLAVMSHELRTPINAIMGYTDLLDAQVAGPMNEKQQAHLERVRSSSLHLVGLIDQVLSLARIEAGYSDIHNEPADLAQLARDAAAMIEPLAARQGLELRTYYGDGPVIVVTDVGKVTQILLNLLNNAVKFTEDGTIGLSLERKDGKAVFSVSDTGIGIPHDRLGAIFEPFVQVDQQMSRRAGGAGLGLSVSRQLARLLGGELTVVSEPGRGSTFTLTVPATPAVIAPRDQQSRTLEQPPGPG